MLIKKYILRKELTEKALRTFITRFFRTKNFGKRYLNLYVNVEGVSSIQLGKRVVIDTENKQEIYGFLEMVSKDLHKSKYTPKAKDCIYIYYIETDRDIYNNYIEKISSI